MDKRNGTVVLTGTSTGIGRACALHLDSLGFKVYSGVRTERDGKSLKQEASHRLTPVILDLTDDHGIAKAVEIVEGSLGQDGLTGLVNNAGIVVPGPLELIPRDELWKQLHVNLIGHIAVTQAFLPLLRKHKGRIVNIGSVGGIQAMPFLGLYDASKAGLHALTDSLRMELRALGIHVSLVIPGHIATPIWGKSRDMKENLTAKLSQEALKAYRSGIDAFVQGTQKMEQGGLPPEAVAKVVARALVSRKPKTRYIVGIDARLQSLMARLLPDRIRDALVLRAIGFT